jgi:hypothetical protein
MAPKVVRPKRRPYPPPRHRALELLASCRDGCTEAVMRAHGFTMRQLVDLVREGLWRGCGLEEKGFAAETNCED